MVRQVLRAVRRSVFLGQLRGGRWQALHQVRQPYQVLLLLHVLIQGHRERN
jgi:hypothetical protein